MQSLEARKKQHAEQRAENLKDSPIQDTGITVEGADQNGKVYADMTVAELQEAAKAMGQEVPKEKTLKADILAFVENLAKFKAADSQDENGTQSQGSSWSAGNGV